MNFATDNRIRLMILITEGTIRCSNLCTEIIEYTSPNETAVSSNPSSLDNLLVTCFLKHIPVSHRIRFPSDQFGFVNLSKVCNLASIALPFFVKPSVRFIVGSNFREKGSNTNDRNIHHARSGAGRREVERA